MANKDQGKQYGLVMLVLGEPEAHLFCGQT